MERRAGAYDYRLDVLAKQNLDLISDSPLLMERREANVRFVRRQMETLLGEKFNVLLSTSRYNLIDGRLCGENMFEPAIDSFRRGRDHRRIHGNPIDFPREDAEIIGLEKIEPYMARAGVGEMVFFASLPGGTYRHRFHDIFTKMIDEDGREYVEARRYSSGMSIEEYRDFVRSLGVDVPDTADEVYFLANPVSINDSRFKTAEDVHRYLHRQHSYMPRDVFEQRILEPSMPYIDVYAKSPSLLTFKAVLNRSDEVNEERKNGILSIVNEDSVALSREIYRLGSKDIKEENLPCGNLSDAQENSAFSVAEYDITYSFDKFGSCKSCGSESSLGPCGICKSCDVSMREKKKLGIAA